jgi:hypothetical protein
MNLNRAKRRSDRIYELIDLRPSIAELSEATDLPAIKGKVELRKVSFWLTRSARIAKLCLLTRNPGSGLHW